MIDKHAGEMTRAAALAARWGARFPAEELRVLAEAGYGCPMGFGSSPALLVVDVTYAFCGRTPKPVLEAVRESRRSCGEKAWASIPAIRDLLGAARSAGVPIVFSVMRDPSSAAFDPGLWGAKNQRGSEDTRRAELDNVVVDEVGPEPGELVLAKDKPSIFHGTGLLPYLVRHRVDSLIVCGGTTSGCVYASAVDGFSHNYKVGVVADACFDRVDAPHWACLLDIDMKYGDVVDSDDATRYLNTLAARTRSRAARPHAGRGQR